MIITFAAAIVGGVIGWFGKGWSQRTTVRGNDNTVGSAGRDLMHVGGDQVNISHSSASDPYVSVEIVGGFVMLINTSRDLPAHNVTWKLDAKASSQVSYWDAIEVPADGITLAPGGTRRIARWAPAFGSEPVAAVVSWAGEDGQLRQRYEPLP